jgi:hypothetical protein
MATTATSTETLANDLREGLQGHVPDETLEAAVKQVQADATGVYPAHGAIASLILYVKVQVVINNGKTFDGNAWGVTFPGGGALFGDVYLYADSLDTLYANTRSFYVFATQVYTAVYFFDSSNSCLASFQAGAVSTVGGHCGGEGRWS